MCSTDQSSDSNNSFGKMFWEEFGNGRARRDSIDGDVIADEEGSQRSHHSNKLGIAAG